MLLKVTFKSSTIVKYMSLCFEELVRNDLASR